MNRIVNDFDEEEQLYHYDSFKYRENSRNFESVLRKNYASICSVFILIIFLIIFNLTVKKYK